MIRNGCKMLFNSLAYAVFLPVVFILYWVIPTKYRWVLLLIASYYFYMSWNYKYVVLILFTTIVSYSASLLLERTKKKAGKHVIVMSSLVLCLGVLFVFKYYNFAMDTIAHFSLFEPRYLDLLLPVGISFYTFQTLSYVIDVYRGEISAEKHFGKYATFVSFFPQLVAGPIERSSNLLPQINKKHEFDADNIYYGIRLIVWGLFKKMLIADNLAVFVDLVYGDIYSYTGGTILIATVFFTVQIYCDFSGYSDIARGSAKMFGIELMENFKSPYFSTSVKDFWGRWHISLSSWFKDYLYIPLGGNRVTKIRNCINVMIIFLVSGLWHGASWNFVVWGGIHGLAQVYENAFGIKKTEGNDIFVFIRRMVVFAFVSFAWIFFRVDNIREGFYAAFSILEGIDHPIGYLREGFQAMGLHRDFLPYLELYLVPLFVFDFVSLKKDVIAWIGTKGAIVRHGYMVIIILLLLFYCYVGESTFVYFQF